MCLYRNIGWFVLEGTSEIISFLPPCHRQGHSVLDQVAQSPIQPASNASKEWGIHNLSEQPAPVLQEAHSKEFFS